MISWGIERKEDLRMINKGVSLEKKGMDTMEKESELTRREEEETESIVIMHRSCYGKKKAEKEREAMS